MRILAGDVGGTKTRLALLESDGDRLARVGLERVYASREHESLGEIARALLGDAEEAPEAAVFGVPGPVREGRGRTTNLPWEVDARLLSRELGVAHVALLNDLEALAWAVEALPEASLETLAAGEPDPTGNAAVLAPGTGLGEAGLAWDGERRRPFATEGGHASFAPRDELEIALLRQLSARHRHVSWERVLSGPGLVALHGFLVEHRRAEVPAWLAEAMAAGDPAAAISEAALAGRCEICCEAVELFVRLLGAEAGNLALKLKATAGVYIGGGIATKLLPALRRPPLLEAFRAKGRMRPLLEAVPVKVLLDEGAALLGAGRYALISETQGP